MVVIKQETRRKIRRYAKCIVVLLLSDVFGLFAQVLCLINVSCNVLLFRCGTPGESVFDLCNNNKTTFITGDYYLMHSGITRPIYIDILVLVTLVFTFRILGYIILRYIRRPGGCKHK